MFNEKLKLEYTEAKKARTNLSNNYLEHLFEKASIIEKSKGKDLYDFNVNDIIEFYKYLNMRSYDTLVVLNSHCSLYTDYCLKRGFVKDNQNHYLEINKDIIINSLNVAYNKSKIVDDEGIVQLINRLDNACDKFIIRCLYEGICGKYHKDIFLMKLSDIDEKRNQVRTFSGRIVNVSTTLISYAKESNDTYEYLLAGSERSVKLYETGYIIKRRKNQMVYSDRTSEDEEFKQMCRARVNRVMKGLGCVNSITTNSIVESGIISFINKYAAEHNMSGMDCLYQKDCLEKIYKQFDKKIVRSTFGIKHKNFLVG